MTNVMTKLFGSNPKVRVASPNMISVPINGKVWTDNQALAALYFGASDEKFMIPVNCNGNHWCSIMIELGEKKRIYFYDPMESSYKTGVRSAAQVAKQLVPEQQLDGCRAQSYGSHLGVQTDSYNCGIYVLIAFELFAGAASPGLVDKRTLQYMRYRYLIEAVLMELQERRIEREQDIEQYSNAPLHEVDQEDTDTPLMDPFKDLGGPAAIKDMTNFSLREFKELWISVRDHVRANYNVGRGRRSEIKPKDAFFMTLVMLKEGGTWDSNAKRFRLATTTFTDVVTKFIKMLAPKVYVDYVEERCDQATMRMARTKDKTFRNYPCALYAVDVTFQQSWRPGGSISENGKFYSGKHHLYGLKVEVSVDSRGFAINCSHHEPGATHDITMFKENKAFHLQKIKKLPSEETLPDEGPLLDTHPDEWAILADKGYQGAAEFLRCIIPKKGRNISRADQSNNDKIAHDRVIVENYFGRLNILWRITADKYRLARELYDDVFRLCVGLTNAHVTRCSLRSDNGDWYRRSQNKLIELGIKIKQKRRLAQEKYRAKKRRRLSSSISDLGGEEDASEDALTQLSQAF
ncbi:hypothetical protein PHMEG_00029871 [Phytophthora megakarya]|uniref:Ubiquitin-like protease family profile domain-containing protein n=1 Tax=Phytophthora megakarya TaxID=4795 RepID=A0A225V2H5_9STRA|nr:hypothetical protein PHMEG_00029871 [Phytophthora megakarya]